MREYLQTEEEVLAGLGVSGEGLSGGEAEAREQKFGRSESVV